MTNLQQGAPVLSPQGLRRLWLGAPAAALGAVSLALAAAVLAPMWQSLQRDSTRLRELEDLQMQVSLMRQQIRAQDIQEERAIGQRDKLLRMIAGSGDVSTLLAVLDRVAKEAAVQLNLVEPRAAGAVPAGQTAPSGGNPPAPPPAPNPLETAGLQAQSMLISVRGPYPNLLGFLRRLESLNLLVIQSDLKLEAPPPSTDPKKPAPQDVTMKLSLQVYGRSGLVEGQASAPAPARPPSAAPAAPPGSAGAPAPPTGTNPAATPVQPAPAGTNPSAPQGSAAPPAGSPPTGAQPAGR